MRPSTTTASEEHCRSFELEEKQVLVGLDENTRSAAVMAEQTYRAGMADTYAADTDHYEVLTDPKEAKAALDAAEERIWAAWPRWIPKLPMEIGIEYLNLKEK